MASESKKRARSPSASVSTETTSSTITDTDSVYSTETPEEYVHNSWKYVSSMGLRGEHVDEEKLKQILDRLDSNDVKEKCQTDDLLQGKCNALRNKIRDLLRAWELPKVGGKKSRRRRGTDKRSRATKKRRSSRKNKK